MAVLYNPPTTNGLSKTLDAQLDEATTSSMTLNNVTGVPNAPGVVVIDRVDGDGNLKSAAVREWVAYTGTSGNTLTGLTRAIGGSTDQDHAVGAVVEFVMDITWGQSVVDALEKLVNSSDISLYSPNLALLGTLQTFTGANHFTKVNTFATDINLATGGNIQENNTDPWRTIDISPGFLKPTTTSGAASSQTIEAGTNDIDYDTIDFDKTSQENAFFNFKMPDSWDGNAVQFRFDVIGASGGGNQFVEMELAGRSYASGDDIDQAVGDYIGCIVSLPTSGKLITSPWSSNTTLSGGPAAGEYVHFEVRRDVSSDDYDADARLVQIQLRYKQAKFSD